MGPRHRAKTLGGHVERDERSLATVLCDGSRGCRPAGHGKIERGHPIRQIVAEAADVAYRERFGRGVHGEVGMADAVDLACGHDRPRAWAIERPRQFRLPPELRKQGDNQPGPIRCKHRQHELDGIRQLDSDHGIDRQAGFNEVSRQRRDGSIGLHESKPSWRRARDALLVEGIEQRQCVRLPRQDPAKQSIKRWRYVGLDHGISWAFELSLFWIIWVGVQTFATMSPEGIRSKRWPWDILSDSSGRSIALGH